MLKRSSISPDSPNLINESTRIHGQVEANESLRIDGKVEGNIHCSARLVIGKNAEIQGNIVCQHLELLGKIFGDVLAQNSCTLRSSALLKGNLSTSLLSIENGAQFQGQCTMLESKSGE
ncbi:MAG: polymer-forming cytoskeletal protein [Bacteroidetes bacterium]|nr:polymer-forming cytoskeletal protein [Bacteroidota bacterium]